MEIYLNYNRTNLPLEEESLSCRSNLQYTEVSVSMKPISGLSSIPFKINKEFENYFFVKGIYNSSDSYGYDAGISEYVEVFENEQEAHKFRDMIKTVDQLNSPYLRDLETKNSLRKTIEEHGYEAKLYKFAGIEQYGLEKDGKKYPFPWGGNFYPLVNIEVVWVPMHK